MSTPVLLVDGQNLLYRAHFSHRELRSSSGFPTSVLYGFFDMLLVAKRWAGANEVVVFFDRPLEDPTQPVQTFRKRLYAEYKGQRKPNPDMELVWQQCPALAKVLRILRFPVHVVPGVEADDLIGLSSAHLHYAGRDSVVYSNDQDFYQLCNERVTILRPTAKGGVEAVRRSRMIRELGFPPRRMVDYKALVGDTSDNYKGLRGCGPKLAKPLLQAGARSNLPLAQQPSAVVKLLGKRAAQWDSEVPLCYKLARIITDPESKRLTDAERTAVYAMCDEVAGYRRRFRQEEKAFKRFLRFCERYDLTVFTQQRLEFFQCK